MYTDRSQANKSAWLYIITSSYFYNSTCLEAICFVSVIFRICLLTSLKSKEEETKKCILKQIVKEEEKEEVETIKPLK